MRPWIVSALLAAAVAGGYLWFTRGPDGDADTSGPEADASRPPHTPLTEREVLTYLEVMPELTEALARVSAEFAAEWERAGQHPDDPRFAHEAQAARDHILAKHRLTQATFDRLRQRVEYAVDAMRYIADTGRRNAELEREIREKRQLLDMLGEGKARNDMAARIAQLEEQLVAGGPPLHESDEKLLTKYWERLEPVVPPRRAATGSGPRAGPPPR